MCATPSCPARSWATFLERSDMPSGDASSGPSSWMRKSPTSSLGRNDRPTSRFSGNVNAKLDKKTAASLVGKNSAAHEPIQRERHREDDHRGGDDRHRMGERPLE